MAKPESEPSSEQIPKIRPLGVSAQSPIFLQPKPIIVQKNFNDIPKNWLELQILELLRWAFQEGDAANLSSFLQLDERERASFQNILQVYDEKGSKICICQFYDKYSQTWSLNSYFSNGVSCENPEKYTGPLKYLDNHTPEECKIIDDWLQTPNYLISDGGNVSNNNESRETELHTPTVPTSHKLIETPQLIFPSEPIHTTEALTQEATSANEQNRSFTITTCYHCDKFVFANRGQY